MALAVEANPQSGDVATLEQGLLAFEERRLGSPEHAHFAVFLRDGFGNVQGGLDAHIMWRRLFIKTLWIAEDYRHMGHGSRLMAATEAEARARRCRSIWLTALGDRACRFYLKLDYSIFGMLEDYVGGQSLYSLQKDL